MKTSNLAFIFACLLPISSFAGGTNGSGGGVEMGAINIGSQSSAFPKPGTFQIPNPGGGNQFGGVVLGPNTTIVQTKPATTGFFPPLPTIVFDLGQKDSGAQEFAIGTLNTDSNQWDLEKVELSREQVEATPQLQEALRQSDESACWISLDAKSSKFQMSDFTR